MEQRKKENIHLLAQTWRTGKMRGYWTSRNCELTNTCLEGTSSSLLSNYFYVKKKVKKSKMGWGTLLQFAFTSL